jgi:hypothetical protein
MFMLNSLHWTLVTNSLKSVGIQVVPIGCNSGVKFGSKDLQGLNSPSTFVPGNEDFEKYLNQRHQESTLKICSILLGCRSLKQFRFHILVSFAPLVD